MMGVQLALIRRELLEHRSLYVVPAVLALLIVLVDVTGQATLNVYGKHIDAALLGATHVGVHERAALISAMLAMLSWLFVSTMWLLVIFYTLDSLFAERKDKSILFWRSLPVTDSETVISKLLTATIVIPLITLAFIAATHILVLIATSIWVGSKGANAWHLIWEAAPLLDNWGATLIVILAVIAWLSPYVGWFLLVSSYTKRSPMLVAMLPIIVLPLFEKLLFSSETLMNQVWLRVPQIPIYQSINVDGIFDEEMFKIVGDEGISLIALLDVGKFMTSPSMRGGIFVCGLFTTAAIFVRRYRGES